MTLVRMNFRFNKETVDQQELIFHYGIKIGINICCLYFFHTFGFVFNIENKYATKS